MNYREKKAEQPEEKRQFKTMREMDLHILTKQYGAERAASIMQFADALMQFYQTSKIKYSA